MLTRWLNVWLIGLALLFTVGLGRSLAEDAKPAPKEEQPKVEGSSSSTEGSWKKDVGTPIYQGLKSGAEKVEKGVKEESKEAKERAEEGGKTIAHVMKHDVGDTIYHGLKKGASKIKNFFTGGGGG